jgi:PPP family 3-phenylpropionic acid transporter
VTPRFAISAFYFTYLGALGIFWPYFSLYLHGVGLAPREVTQLMALYPVMGLVAPPLFGLVADARSARGWMLRAVSGLTLLAFLGFFAAGGARLPLYLALGLFAFCRAPVLPLTDASALECARATGSSYGAMRMWGSLGFLVAALVTGALIERLGSAAVLPATVVSLALAAGTAWLMPAPPPTGHPQALDATLRLVRDGELWLFLIASVLGYLATAAYDAGFSLHLQGLGLDARFVGQAWAVGVASEVVFMLLQGAIFRRFSAEKAFAFSLAVAALRWGLLSRVTSPAVILMLQPLHGITFGCFYTAGVTVMRDRGGPHAPAAAQGLFASSLALGSMTGMWATGRILEVGGGRALYGAAAVMAALGCAAAVGYLARVRRRLARLPIPVESAVARSPDRRII